MKQCPTCRTMRNPYGFKSHVKWCGVPFNEQQFWDSMERLPWSGCWIWTKASLHYGYGGVVWYPHPGAKHVLTGIHRVAWILTYGPIPPGLHVCHTCDNPPCIEPLHLFIGTNQDNLRDAYLKGRYHSRNIARGEAHRSAKLTAAQVSELRSLRAAGVSLRTLGARYGINSGTVSRAATGKTWKTVPS